MICKSRRGGGEEAQQVECQWFSRGALPRILALLRQNAGQYFDILFKQVMEHLYRTNTPVTQRL